VYITDVVMMDDAIEIINFTRRPVGEVWFLRVTTISDNYIPITKTAFRKITTPNEKLVEDLILMIRNRLNSFVGVVDEDTGEPMSLEEAGFEFYLNAPNGSTGNLNTWYDEGHHPKGYEDEILQGPFEWFMDGAGGQNPQGTIDCIITNATGEPYKFQIIPSWLPKSERPPQSFNLRPSKKGYTVTLFIKCVRVKVK